MSVIAENAYKDYDAQQRDNSSVAMADGEAKNTKRGARGSNFRFDEGDEIEFAPMEKTGKLDLRKVTIPGSTNSFVSCTVLKNGTKLVQICESNLENSVDIYTESNTGKAIATGEPPVTSKDPVQSNATDMEAFWNDHMGKKFKCRKVYRVNTKEYNGDKVVMRRVYKWENIPPTPQTNG